MFTQRQPAHPSRRTALVLGVTVVGGLFLFLGWGALAESFRDPVTAPTTGVTTLPIKSDVSPAIKIGALTVAGNVTIQDGSDATIGAPSGTSKLCLNPLNQTTTYCVQQWGDVSFGPFLILNTVDPGVTQSNLFASLQAGATQDFAIQGASAGSGSSATYGVAGIVSNSANPLAAGVAGIVPGATGQDGEAWAAIFNGDGSGTGPSGQVAARVLDADGDPATTTDRRVTVGTAVTPSQTCLYGDSSQDCISRWEEIERYADPNASFLVLQQVTPSTSQIGSTSTKGNARFGSVVVGTPGANARCGDGVCTAGVEGSASCPVDCASVVSGPTFNSGTGVVSWMTSTPTTTIVHYGLSSNVYSDSIGASTTLTTTHDVNLSALASGFYNIRVSGATASGAPVSTISSVTIP